jgi:hypothetical protein
VRPDSSVQTDLRTTATAPRGAALNEEECETQQPHHNSGHAHRKRRRPAVPGDENDDRCHGPDNGPDSECGPGVGEPSDLRGNVVCVIHNLQTSSSALQ